MMAEEHSNIDFEDWIAPALVIIGGGIFICAARYSDFWFAVFVAITVYGFYYFANKLGNMIQRGEDRYERQVRSKG